MSDKKLPEETAGRPRRRDDPASGRDPELDREAAISPVGMQVSGDLPEEDEDNAYQNSDEALPDDREERAIARDPDREGGRFDEI